MAQIEKPEPAINIEEAFTQYQLNVSNIGLKQRKIETLNRKERLNVMESYQNNVRLSIGDNLSTNEYRMALAQNVEFNISNLVSDASRDYEFNKGNVIDTARRVNRRVCCCRYPIANNERC